MKSEKRKTEIVIKKLLGLTIGQFQAVCEIDGVLYDWVDEIEADRIAREHRLALLHKTHVAERLN